MPVITTDYTDVKKTPKRVETSKKAPAYTGVRIIVGTNDSGAELVYEAGTDTGSVLEITNPFGTQAMANAILEDIGGYAYQPFRASRAILDPAAEIGDGVSAGSVYGGMYRRSTSFGRLMASDVEAPFDEEIVHEYGNGRTSTDRKYTRLEAQYKASLSITNAAITAEVTRATEAEGALSGRIDVTAAAIAAKVSQTGGSSQSFGWTLTASGFVLSSGNSEVFRADANGITVTGQINATSGHIGNSSTGFTINATSITNGKSSLTDNNDGVYIGTDGIALGANSAFKVTKYGAIEATNLAITGGSINIGNAFIVDSLGNLTASSGTFEGNVYASNIQYGSGYGYLNAAGIEEETIVGGSYGQIAYETIPTYNISSGVNTSIGYGEAAYNNITDEAAGSISCYNLVYRYYGVQWERIECNNGTFYVLAR